MSLLTIKTLSLGNINSFYVISDIHANGHALKAVLSAIPQNSYIFCCGDILGYYINPNEVCEMLRERKVFAIKGNHDKYLLGELNYPASREDKYRIKNIKDQLSSEHSTWINSLPDIIELSFKANLFNDRLMFVHGSPVSSEQYIYQDTMIDFDLELYPLYLFMGHTHHPMLRKVGNHTLINPGSIGQPRNWNPEASYVHFNLCDRVVSFLSIPYDVAKYQERLRESSVSCGMINMLSRVR